MKFQKLSIMVYWNELKVEVKGLGYALPLAVEWDRGSSNYEDRGFDDLLTTLEFLGKENDRLTPLSKQRLLSCSQKEG